MIAIASIYDVDLMTDNLEACRNRLYEMWNTAYEGTCGSDTSLYITCLCDTMYTRAQVANAILDYVAPVPVQRP